MVRSTYLIVRVYILAARSWCMSTEHNSLVRSYLRRIDPTATPAEAYGYWILLAGILAGISGIALFVYGSTFPRGDATYWTYRQAGIALAAGGLPVALLGVTIRLTLQPVAAALASLGLITCTAAIAWFVALYPAAWTFAGPRPVITTYVLGIALVAAGLTVVPITSTRLQSNARTEHAYYDLQKSEGGWRWRLHAGDHALLAESSGRFPTREAARASLEDLAAAAPIAGTEVTIDTHSQPPATTQEA